MSGCASTQLLAVFGVITQPVTMCSGLLFADEAIVVDTFGDCAGQDSGQALRNGRCLWCRSI